MSNVKNAIEHTLVGLDQIHATSKIAAQQLKKHEDHLIEELDQSVTETSANVEKVVCGPPLPSLQGTLGFNWDHPCARTNAEGVSTWKYYSRRSFVSPCPCDLHESDLFRELQKRGLLGDSLFESYTKLQEEHMKITDQVADEGYQEMATKIASHFQEKYTQLGQVRNHFIPRQVSHFWDR